MSHSIITEKKVETTHTLNLNQDQLEQVLKQYIDDHIGELAGGRLSFSWSTHPDISVIICTSQTEVERSVP